MNIEFEENEFTSHELLDYLKRAYGSQINGAPFSAYNINNWIRIGKIPMAYGDHRILKVVVTPEFNNYRVITIEGLTRDILSDLELLGFNLKSGNTVKTKRPRKQRTQFYFQTLKKLGKQYTRKTLSILPENWKEVGIKANQLARTRYRTG
jgi:hypothetical protein